MWLSLPNRSRASIPTNIGTRERIRPRPSFEDEDDDEEEAKILSKKIAEDRQRLVLLFQLNRSNLLKKWKLNGHSTSPCSDR